MSDPIKYKLQYPVEVGGEKITEVAFRRPKGRDMRLALNKGKNVGDLTTMMIVNLGEVSPEVVDEFDCEDWIAMSKIVGNFLGGQDSPDGVNNVTAH